MTTEELKICQPINREQTKMMVEFMADHQDLARGRLKLANGKRTSNSLWAVLGGNLNACGPPIRSSAEWKKVWADYKYKVKKKLRFNINSKRKTGGGPIDQKYLDELEESVVVSAGLTAAVEGIPGTLSFGCQPSTSENVECDFYLLDEHGEDVETVSPTEKENAAPIKRRKLAGKTDNRNMLLREYIEATKEGNQIQREILEVKRKSLELREKKYLLKVEKRK